MNNPRKRNQCSKSNSQIMKNKEYYKISTTNECFEKLLLFFALSLHPLSFFTNSPFKSSVRGNGPNLRAHISVRIRQRNAHNVVQIRAFKSRNIYFQTLFQNFMWIRTDSFTNIIIGVFTFFLTFRFRFLLWLLKWSDINVTGSYQFVVLWYIQIFEGFLHY